MMCWGGMKKMCYLVMLLLPQAYNKRAVPNSVTASAALAISELVLLPWPARVIGPSVAETADLPPQWWVAPGLSGTVPGEHKKYTSTR